MESEWKSLIVWFCLGLFVMAEVGNVQMGSEIGRMLSGHKLTNEALKHAERLIEMSVE